MIRPSVTARIFCRLWFHKLRVVQQLSQYAQKLRCNRCGRYYAVHNEWHVFVRWDAELEAFYRQFLGIDKTAK
jgi:hypothetical protein